jgi:hypothetical protein
MQRQLISLTLSLSAFHAACMQAPEPDDDAEVATAAEELRTTTPVALPNHLTLGHLDDAVGTDVIQYEQNRMFVTRSTFGGAPVMHHYYPANISSLIVGDFAVAGTREHGRDQVCAILTTGAMECAAPSDDRTELWWWFTQPNPLLAGEKAIVGDFTGDGAQDLLAFNASTGGIRLLSRTQTGVFAPVTAYAPGNLTSFNLTGYRLYAGEFGQTVGRADLLAVDPTNGRVIRFDTATDTSGRTTFWWAFTTDIDALDVNEQITIANLDGGTRDAILLRDTVSGRYRMAKAEYANGSLASGPLNVNTGQLPITPDSAIVAAAKLSSHPGEPGPNRDDLLFFNRATGAMISDEARWDGSRYTYWWAYTKLTPSQAGWLPRQDTTMAVVLCKLADVTRTPDTAGIKKAILGVGEDSVRDYIFATTFGTTDVAKADVYGWVTSSLKAADSSARKGDTGWKTGDYIASCAAKAGFSPSDYGGRVLVVLNDTNVAYQGINNYGAAVDYDSVLRGEINSVSHETLHGFGLNHADDDTSALCGGSPSKYCDTSDVMGNFYNTDVIGAHGWSTGPELNGLHRLQLGVVPASRTITLDASSPAKTVVTLAPLEQPEAAGTLVIQIPTSGRNTTVSYRRAVGLDANTGVNGVQVHKTDPTTATESILKTSPARTLTAGATTTLGAFTMHLDAIDAASGTATVTLTH